KGEEEIWGTPPDARPFDCPLRRTLRTGADRALPPLQTPGAATLSEFTAATDVIQNSSIPRPTTIPMSASRTFVGSTSIVDDPSAAVKDTSKRPLTRRCN